MYYASQNQNALRSFILWTNECIRKNNEWKIVVLRQVGRHFQLMMFDDLQPLKHLCIGGYEMTHGYKSIHDFYADINGSIAVKN